MRKLSCIGIIFLLSIAWLGFDHATEKRPMAYRSLDKVGGDIANVIVEDFEKKTQEDFKPSISRGCSLKLTSKYFVLSGKKSAEFIVTNENIDPQHPPYFTVSFSLTDWREYNSFKFPLLILPFNAVSEAGMLIQFHSTDFDNVRWGDPNQVSNFWFKVPVGKPVVVSIPITGIAFKEKVGEVLICATSTPGIYFIDKMEISKEKVNKVLIKDLILPQNVLVPEWTTVFFKTKRRLLLQGHFLVCRKSTNIYLFRIKQASRKKDTKGN